MTWDTRYILLSSTVTNASHIIAIQDEDTWLAMNDRFMPPDWVGYEINAKVVKSLLEAQEGVGVGVYLAEPDNLLETHSRRSEAIHRYVRFMNDHFKTIAIHEPVALIGVIDKIPLALG